MSKKEKDSQPNIAEEVMEEVKEQFTNETVVDAVAELGTPNIATSEDISKSIMEETTGGRGDDDAE